MRIIAGAFLLGPIAHGDFPWTSPSVDGGNPMRVECRYMSSSCASFLVRFPGRAGIYEFLFAGFHRVWFVGRRGFCSYENVEFIACSFHPIIFHFSLSINSWLHVYFFSWIAFFLPSSPSPNK